MTVRVTTLKGADAGAYYVEALPNYYLDSGEPRGVWLGDGASLLGLADEVADEQFLALMAGMDPQRPDRALGRAYDDTSVRGFDVTCSAPKSVSVMFALGDHDVRREVLAAHDAAVAALAGWIERHAHTRYRIGGEVAVVDAEGIVAAAFRQHTSRALDPQIHTHLVIANRVKSPDGRWLALDARLIKHDQQTLSALFHASLRLRRGDVDVLDLYDSHERLRGGPSTQMERNAIHTWWRHRQAGDEVLLMAPTNETVAVLNERAQLIRIHAGEIDPDGRHARIAGGRVFVGDEIATRHNNRRLLTDRGDMVRNRATWTVDRIGSDGSLVATGRNGSVRLPASYVAEHVELAYATTGMGAQGRTVDVGILYLDHPTDVRNIYVPLTRGRSSNLALVATTGEDTAVDLLSRCLTTDWIDQPAHTRRAELTGKFIRPPSALNGEQLRDLFAERYDLRGTAVAAEHARFKQVDEAIWRDIHLRAHRLRLQQPEWAIEQLGPMEETAGMRRLWGIFAAHLEQHHVAYSDVIDHEDAYESHCALVEDLVDQMQERESVSADMSIDM